jgi:hypothetical protein
LYRFDLDKLSGRFIDRDQNVVFVKRKQDGSAVVVGRLMESNGREKFEVKMIDYSGCCLKRKVVALSESEAKWKSFVCGFASC